MSELSKVLVTEKSELLKHCDQICVLFQECFSSDMSVELWRWFYIDNPFGNPVVALCYDGDRLVGHYAVVRNDIVNAQGETLKSALSMTTMVAESHRMHYLFTKLAEDCYQELVNQGYDIVCGFPNAMSAPGFKKRLQWGLGEPDYVASVSKEQLLQSTDLKMYFESAGYYGFDFASTEKLAWRMAKPGVQYQHSGDVIVKEFEGQVDLMHLSPRIIEQLEENAVYNVLLSHTVKDLMDHKIFDYQFGYRDFKDSDRVLDFNISMLMSDVF